MPDQRLARTREAYRRPAMTLQAAIDEAKQILAESGTSDPTPDDIANYVRLLMARYSARYAFDVPSGADAETPCAG
jgi:hypothetical protein